MRERKLLPNCLLRALLTNESRRMIHSDFPPRREGGPALLSRVNDNKEHVGYWQDISNLGLLQANWSPEHSPGRKTRLRLRLRNDLAAETFLVCSHSENSR